MKIWGKKIFAYLIIFAISATMLPIYSSEVQAATSTSTLVVGDYVQFGTYYGQPILWRVINVDGNGPMLFADKILTLKAYDAKEPTNPDADRKSYGSNYWINSNIREWLNSNSATVTYSTQAPSSTTYVYYNSYSTEAGFLNNFTANEQNAIQPVTHEAVLATVDSSLKDGGTAAHTCDLTIGSVTQNYDSSYYKNVTDSVFLLSVKELESYVYNNAALGNGTTYYMAYPTAQAVSNSIYTNASLNASSYWHYWLRTPYADYSYFVRYVDSSGPVNNSTAYTGPRGVRPALYLKSGIFTSGSGTSGDPYVLTYAAPNTTPTISITNSTTNQTINSTGIATISGTVTDPDASQTDTISATINGVQKQTTVATPVAGPAWSLSWSGVELGEGSYPADITVTVDDGNGGTDTATYTGDINVSSTAVSTEVPAVRIQEVKDLKNNDDASDIRVIFWEPSDIAKIASYKVVVSTSTLDKATAAASTNYMAQSIKGKNRMHLIYLPETLKTSGGGAINAAGGTYNVYVLAVAKTGYSDKITGPVSVNLGTTNTGSKVEASTPLVMDIANNNNGTDLRVNFRKSKDETNMQEYRIIASTTTLDLVAANSVPDAGYKVVTPTDLRSSYVVTLGSSQTDQGGTTAIQNGTSYKVYVLAVGKNGYANALSNTSKSITLSTTVPGTPAVRGLRALYVGEGNDSSNIKVNFYEPVANSGVEEYRIFISPAAITLGQATAEGAVSTLYQAVSPTRRGALHSVTLNAGLHDCTDTVLGTGEYKVYVLTVGKSGSASRMSAASGNVVLP